MESVNKIIKALSKASKAINTAKIIFKNKQYSSISKQTINLSNFYLVSTILNAKE